MNKLLIKDWIEINTTKYDTLTEKMVQYISISENIDPHIIFEWDMDKIRKEFKKTKWIDAPISDSNTDIIKLEDKKLKIIDFNTLTYGQFIDLEYYVSEDFINNIHIITSILYLGFEKEKFNNIEWENYSKVDIRERGEYIKNNIYINDILNKIKKYLDFRKNIFDSYNFFYDPLEGVSEDELSTEEEKQIYKEELDKVEKSKKTMWEDILDSVCNGDVTKYDEVLGTNLFIIFNKMSRLRNEQLKNQTKIK